MATREISWDLVVGGELKDITAPSKRSSPRGRVTGILYKGTGAGGGNPPGAHARFWQY
ncbi:hypothetical protein GMSM_22890 [Geomonas sp. Red276]